MIEKNRHGSVPEGLSHDPYIGRCFCEARPNQTDRVVHEFAIFGRIRGLRLLTVTFFGKHGRKSHVGAKINEHDGYETSFTRDTIRPDDVPGSSDLPLHFERYAAALGQRSKD